ncbi:major facilitator superfamily domain-containing protein 6-A-like [Artemia franciscana]|uniref:Major facilitator superfamily associated domain-containing protein n=1 Tax=Artemia franciscana TaxID=6661 RepID=A0AA88HQQ0_ARTSF|nr:hypothetical protein QYM36_009111 [Artemia franciscana]
MGKMKKIFTVDKETVSLKATLFLFYGAMYALLPYLTIHMVEVGLSIEEIGLIYAVLPFASFAGPPIAGMIADYIGNYKLVLHISLFFTGLFYTLLLMVDAKGLPRNMTNTTMATFQCSQNTTELIWSKCENSCDLSTELNLTLLMETCHSECPTDTMTSDNTKFLSNSSRIEFVLLKQYDQNGTCRGDIVPKFSLLEELQCTCFKKCQAVLDGFDCPESTRMSIDLNHPYFDEKAHNRGFWQYFFLRTIATLFTGVNFSMLDSTTLCKVRETGGQYGRQRLWATLGSAIASPLTGGLVDLMSRWRGFADYSITFYISDFLILLTMLSLFKVELLIEKAEDKFVKNVQRLIKLPDVDVFIVMMIVLGSMWGFIESFLFIFLKDLESPTYLLGLTVTASSITGIPFMYSSKWIMNKVGEINLIILAFLTYAVRLVGYSLIHNPWLCFPFEIMEIITQHLMATASATYCAAAAPVGLLATLTGLVGGAHYNIGRGTGSYLGGYFISIFGLRLSFQYMGTISAIAGITYAALHFSCLRKFERRRNNETEMTTVFDRKNQKIDDRDEIQYSTIWDPNYVQSNQLK